MLKFLGKTPLWLALAWLAATPVAAQDQGSRVARDSAPTESPSDLRGNPTLYFVLSIVAVAAGIFLLIDDDDEDAASP